MSICDFYYWTGVAAGGLGSLLAYWFIKWINKK